MKKVAVLGSTGSIGVQALQIIDGNPELSLHSILCNANIEKLNLQREKFNPSVACMVEPSSKADSKIISGDFAIEAAIDEADLVLNAIVGSAGLKASLMTVERGLSLALANKESLVAGGDLLEDSIEKGLIIPIDSEHSTIFRCLQGESRCTGITLTASGGALRNMSADKMKNTSPSDVLAHPTWNMGARITVDSATMVNKAFEVMEAGWLFPGVPVDVVIHPQSIIHSFVRMADGSWKALLGSPDMRIPIQYALLYPDGRLNEVTTDIPADWGNLELLEVEKDKYPAFNLVMQAGKDGKGYPAVANAADEIAVAAFLKGRIGFGGIAKVIEIALEQHNPVEISTFDDVMDADKCARRDAEMAVEKLC